MVYGRYNELVHGGYNGLLWYINQQTSLGGPILKGFAEFLNGVGLVPSLRSDGLGGFSSTFSCCSYTERFHKLKLQFAKI